MRSEAWPTTETSIKKLSKQEPTPGRQYIIITNKIEGSTFSNNIRKISIMRPGLITEEHFIPLRIETRPLRENRRRNGRIGIIARLEKLTDLTVTAIEISQHKAIIQKKANRSTRQDIYGLTLRLRKLRRKQNSSAKKDQLQ